MQKLIEILNIDKPLPDFGGWAVSEKFAVVMANEILNAKPTIIVETGCGLSTIIAGYCLRKNRRGRIISLEHDRQYANKIRAEISGYGLNALLNILYCPLREYIIHDNADQWYDNIPEVSIDMLIIDGPPGTLQKHARYPSIPLLYRLLSKNAVIILDDAGRQEEKEIINLWLNKYPAFSHEYINIGRGISILKHNRRT